MSQYVCFVRFEFHRMEDAMRRATLTGLLLFLLVGIVVVFYLNGEYNASAYLHPSTHILAHTVPAHLVTVNTTPAYLYYTLKQTTGFVLARAPRGSNGQPLSAPQ